MGDLCKYPNVNLDCLIVTPQLLAIRILNLTSGTHFSLGSSIGIIRYAN